MALNEAYERGLLVPKTHAAHLLKLLLARQSEIESLVKGLMTIDSPSKIAKVIPLRPGGQAELPFPS